MLGVEMDPFPRELPPLAHHVLGVHHRLHFPHIVASRTPRRCLFGIADPNATRTTLNTIIQEEAERCVKTWEFDPIAGKPVENPKRFPWVKVPATTPADPEEKVVAASECPGRTSSIPRRAEPFPGKENLVVPVVEASSSARVSDVGEDGLPRSVVSVTTEGVAEDPDSLVSERSREARRFAPYRQPRITDFWRQRKCSGEVKSKEAVTVNTVVITDTEAQSSTDGH